MSEHEEDLFKEIDIYVEQLFNQPGPSKDGGTLHGEVLTGDWRIDRIDQIIEDAYQEAIWWHNKRISDGCDPRSGLRTLKYVPWDERIDGVAAMRGAIAAIGVDRAYEVLDYAKQRAAFLYSMEQLAQKEATAKENGLVSFGLLDIALATSVGIGFVILLLVLIIL